MPANEDNEISKGKYDFYLKSWTYKNLKKIGTIFLKTVLIFNILILIQ